MDQQTIYWLTDWLIEKYANSFGIILCLPVKNIFIYMFS